MSIRKLILALLLLFAFVCFNANCGADGTGSRIFQKNFTPMEDAFSVSLKMQLKKKTSDKNKKETQFYKSIMDLYNAQDYEVAIQKMETHFGADPFTNTFHEEELKFYLGQSYLATGNFKKADYIFEQLSGKNVFKYNTDMQWYRALTFIELDQKDAAITSLETIVRMQTQPYVERAEKLLQEIK